MTVNIHEAKTTLSKLIRLVADGEHITIAKAGVPIATLSPYRSNEAKDIFGLYAGEGYVADDFDEPLIELEKALDESINDTISA